MALPGLKPPPEDLHLRTVTVLKFDDVLFRTHATQYFPVFFAKTGSNRFDSPDGGYSVLYTGRDRYCAFIETFAWAAGTQIITTSALKKASLSELKATRTLQLIDLTQSGALVRMGTDARLFSGPHESAQLWSKALHGHSCGADGIIYPSRLDPHRHSIVLFEDRAPQLVVLGTQSWYAPGRLRRDLADILDHYQLKLIEP